jgi:hypothetical protein
VGVAVSPVNRGNLNLSAETSADKFRDWPTGSSQNAPGYRSIARFSQVDVTRMPTFS